MKEKISDKNQIAAKALFDVLVKEFNSGFSSQRMERLGSLHEKTEKEIFELLLNAQDDGGNSLTHLAINKDDLSLLQYLIKNEANLNITNKNNETPLSLAIKKGGNLGSYNAEALIKAGADVNLRYEGGNTALHLAIDKGNSIIFNALMEKKESLIFDIRNENNDTALSLAIKKGGNFGSRNAKALIEAVADVNLQYEGDNTALHLAINNGNQAIFNALMEKKESLIFDIRNKNNDTALSLAIKKIGVNSSRNAKALIEAGASLNLRYEGGDTALHLAIKTNNNDIAEKLINSPKMELNLKDQKGRTALHIAIEKGNTYLAKKIIESKKINIDIPDNNKKTALHIAFATGNEDIAKKLIREKASIDKSKLILPGPLNIHDDRIVSFFKSAIKEGDLTLVEDLTNTFKSQLKDKYLTQITGRTLHSYAKAKNKAEIAAYLEGQGFKKQISITDYIIPSKKTKVTNENNDKTYQDLDNMERGNISPKKETHDTTNPKKSWREYLLERMQIRKNPKVR
jgi:ankyrin repeat protein